MKRTLLLFCTLMNCLYAISEELLTEIDEEVDVTKDYIVNPYFNYVEWNTGWETTTGAINDQLNNNKCDGYYMTGYYWENWNSKPFTGKMYQTLHVPNGVYQLSMAAFSTLEPVCYRHDAYVYANTSIAQVGELYNYTVKVWVTDGTLEIGLGMPTLNQNWVGIDNVKLTYLGNSYKTCFGALEELVSSARDIVIDDMWNYGYNTDAWEQIAMVVDEVELQWNTFEDMESIETAYNNVSDAMSVAMTSYHKYALLFSALMDLEAAIDDCKNDSKKDEAQDLFDRTDDEYYCLEWSNEEIDSLIEEINNMCEILKVPNMTEASDENPIDVTGFINNPKYEEYNTDWSGEGWLMNVDYHNVEFYNKNFYYYQTLVGLPDGMYKVDVQCFYRPGTASNSYNLHQKDDKTKLHAKLFAETANVKHTTYLQSIVSDASASKLFYDDVRLSNGTYVPNSMGGAYEYFQKDLYHNYIYVYVTGGTLTIGLEKDMLISEDWTIFTNWSLTYYGENSHHVDGDASGKYSIKYTVDEKIVYRQEFAPGMEVVTLNEVPVKEGHTFIKWNDVPETMPAEDVIISGTFTVNIYKVYYYVGNELVHTAEVAYGEAIPEYIYEPTNEGDEFIGWVGETYATMPAHDVTYTANITNGIGEIENSKLKIENSVIYDLSGRRIVVDDLRELQKGVYIINGVKTVID